METNKKKYWWYVWQKAIGDRASMSAQVSDHVSWIRTALVVSYLITNLVIVLGVWRHW